MVVVAGHRVRSAANGQIDGFPYGSAVDGVYVFLAQSGRIVVLKGS